MKRNWRSPLWLILVLAIITTFFYSNCSNPIGKASGGEISNTDSGSGPGPLVKCAPDLTKIGSTDNPFATPPMTPMSLKTASLPNQKIFLRESTTQKLRGAAALKVSHKAVENGVGDDSDEYIAMVSDACLKAQAAPQKSNLTFAQKVASPIQAAGDDVKNADVWPHKFLWTKMDPSGQLLEQIDSDPCTVSVSPNRRYKLTQAAPVFTTFNDTFRNVQKNWNTLKLEQALSYFFHPTYGLSQTTTTPITVAVIDTGVHDEHLDLTNQMLRDSAGAVIGVDATTINAAGVASSTNARDIDTTDSHGTHVSGIIAAQGNNNMGVTGIAPFAVKIVPVKAFYIDGQDLVSDTATVIKAINWAASRNVDVINMSLGGPGADPALLAALKNAVQKNVFIATAAGNDGKVLDDTFSIYPGFYSAQIQGMVAVGSVNSETMVKSSFSNYGPAHVEIASFGAQNEEGKAEDGIASTFLADQYAYESGTSMASPTVAGAAALAIALYKKATGNKPTPAEIEAMLLASANKVPALETYFQNGNVMDLVRLVQYIYSTHPSQLKVCAEPVN